MQQSPLLQTKLHIPPVRPEVVPRPRLIERLNAGLRTPGPWARKLTLVSAPAGFGKTTLVSEWVHRLEARTKVAWLSLDEGDNDPTRFLAYLIAALETIVPTVGAGALAALQSPQPPPIESILTGLVNDISAIPDNFVLVLDDYHVIGAKPVEAPTSVDGALTFLLEHLPPPPGGMHLVIATRENPQLPLARLRARGQLTEVRVADLRFTPAEAAEFLNQVMDLGLSAEDVAALETHTEGWIAGLQLAALALQGITPVPGQRDATDFIKSFTGSHYFVLDYLVEEVLHQQPQGVQTFLLQTSILDRLTGDLCDAVCFSPAETENRSEGEASSSGTAVIGQTRGQATLEMLDRANLFIVPLDNERRWYRYHHLFAGFLRQRLQQGQLESIAPLTEDGGPGVAKDLNELHLRASQWYEDNGLALEAFHHAAAANDVERAEGLIGSKDMPTHFRSTVNTILSWLASLPKSVRDARPSLWVKSATMSLMAGQTTGVEESLQAAEDALQSVDLDDKTRDLIGQIACARATLALTRYRPDVMLIQARRALEYLHPDNLPFLFTANWALASASFLQGDRAAATQATMEGLRISQRSGDMFSTTLSLSDLGQLQEVETRLYQAAETYRRVLKLMGDHPQPSAGEVHIGLARIHYQWNELEAAEQHGRRSLQLTRQYDPMIDRFVISELFLARLKQARGDDEGAAALLAQVDRSVRENDFVQRMPEVAAAQVRNLLWPGRRLRPGDLAVAAHLAQAHKLPRSQARVYLAQGDASAALAVLEPLRQQAEAKGWQDERLKGMVLQAVAHRAQGQKDEALQVLTGALALAEPGGFVRVFVDEGPPMAQLLSEAAARGIMPDYVPKLLAAFEAEAQKRQDDSYLPPDPIPPGVQPLIEPLTPREQEVLQLIATGRSNPEIAEELVIAVTTVKTHVKNIHGKLQVQRRTEAVARARELGLL
jgi:LuxR family maltose regulon positive regulatory protein